MVIADTPPLQLDSVKWQIVTEANVASVMADLKAKGLHPVLFALDESNYQNMAIDFAKVRAYVKEQHAVVLAMRDYYMVSTGEPAQAEPPTKAEPPAKTEQPTKKKGLAKKLIPFTK